MTIGRVGHHLRRFGYSYRKNEKKRNKPKAEQETAQPTAARFNKYRTGIIYDQGEFVHASQINPFHTLVPFRRMHKLPLT